MKKGEFYNLQHQVAVRREMLGRGIRKDFLVGLENDLLTFAGALSATPTHADDETNQNNYGNKTSDENGQDD